MIYCSTALILFIFSETVDAFENCRTDILPAMNFDPVRYFTGRWYLTAVSLIPSDPSDICEESKSNILPSGVIVEHTLHFFAPIQRFIQSLTISNIDNFQDGLANYSATLKFLEQDFPRDAHQYTVTILDTDYNNYSVRYSCILLNKRKIGIYYVLKRHIDDESADKIIEKILAREHINYSDLIFRKHVTCKFNP